MGARQRIHTITVGQVNGVPQAGQSRCSGLTPRSGGGGGLADGIGALLVGAHRVGRPVDPDDDAEVQQPARGP
jgi:hypothetical protein